MTAALYCLIGYVTALVTMGVVVVVLMVLAPNEEDF